MHMQHTWFLSSIFYIHQTILNIPYTKTPSLQKNQACGTASRNRQVNGQGVDFLGDRILKWFLLFFGWYGWPLGSLFMDIPWYSHLVRLEDSYWHLCGYLWGTERSCLCSLEIPGHSACWIDWSALDEALLHGVDLLWLQMIWMSGLVY